MGFEKLAVIYNQVDNFLDVIRLARIIGDNAIEFGFAPQGIILRGHKGRIFHIVLRQIAEQFAHQKECIGFAIGGQVTHARGFGMYIGAAQLFKGDFFMRHGFDHIGAGDEHIR